MLKNAITSILTFSFPYTLFGHLVGSRTSRKSFVDLRPKSDSRVLDLGCGHGSMVSFLPNVQYVGVDINENYIKTAQKQFGARGTFELSSVTDFFKKIKRNSTSLSPAVSCITFRMRTRLFFSQTPIHVC